MQNLKSQVWINLVSCEYLKGGEDNDLPQILVKLLYFI